MQRITVYASQKFFDDHGAEKLRLAVNLFRESVGKCFGFPNGYNVSVTYIARADESNSADCDIHVEFSLNDDLKSPYQTELITTISQNLWTIIRHLRSRNVLNQGHYSVLVTPRPYAKYSVEYLN